MGSSCSMCPCEFRFRFGYNFHSKFRIPKFLAYKINYFAFVFFFFFMQSIDTKINKFYVNKQYIFVCDKFCITIDDRLIKKNKLKMFG